MKKLLVVVVVIAIALIASVAMAGITGSRHDLSPTGTGGMHATGVQQNEEICVWCHTPHSANTGAKPLWNKSVTGTTYTPYGMTSNATDISSLGSNGTTKACLSCHDGVGAVNSLVNQAGSGGVVADGSFLAAFDTTAQGTAAQIASTSDYYIGTDLTNDHPVGFVYSSTGNLAGKIRGLVGTGSVAKVTSASTVNGTALSATVECSSCHDPHGATGISSFLRISNTGSQLCLACHTI